MPMLSQVQLNQLDQDIEEALNVEGLCEAWSPTRVPADLLCLLEMVADDLEPSMTYDAGGTWRIKCDPGPVVFVHIDEFAIGVCRAVLGGLQAKGKKS
jgi:hypothetical protein